MIKTIDKTAMLAIRKHVENALAPIGEEHGLSIKLGGGSYDRNGSNGKFELQVALVDEDGVVLSPAAEAFKLLAPTEGLKPEHLGETFNTHGEAYKVAGWNPRATKMPIQADRVSDGVSFKFPVSVVKSAFDLKERFAATGS